MRVAITGASGFIGTALRRSLEADGHTVVPVTRAAGQPGSIQWDPDTGRLEAAELEGLDAVVHLAGEGIAERRWSPEQKDRILESRRRGTELLAGALASLSAKPPVLLSGSAVGVYGDRGDESLTEGSVRGNDFLAEVCRTWEAATQPAEAAGIRVAHLRTGIVLSTEGGAFPKMALPFKVGLGGRLGSGHQWMSWISLADEVGAIRFLLDHEVSGPVNLTGPAPVTNREFTEVLGKVLRRPTLFPVPAFAPRLLLGRELADALLFVSQRALPTVLADAGYEFRHPTLEAALRAALGKD